MGVDTGGSDSQFPTTESLVRNALVPIVFAVALATWLGWWGEILRDDRPVAPWVRRVPLTMLVAAIIAINYAHLADQAVGLVLCLVLLAVFVGVIILAQVLLIVVLIRRRHRIELSPGVYYAAG